MPQPTKFARFLHLQIKGRSSWK